MKGFRRENGRGLPKGNRPQGYCSAAIAAVRSGPHGEAIVGYLRCRKRSRFSEVKIACAYFYMGSWLF
jgi:hypothetical protein